MAIKTDQIVHDPENAPPLANPAAQFSVKMSLVDLGRLHRKFVSTDPKETSLKLHVKVAVLSNYSTQFIEKGLELALAARGIRAEIFGAPFNQWESELINPDSATSKFKPDIVLLSLTSSLLAFREAADDPAGFGRHLTDILNQAALRLGSKFLVTMPEALEEEAEATSWAVTWRNDLNVALDEAASDNISLLDLTPLITAVGAANWYAARYLVNGKFISNPENTAVFADYISRQICGLVNRATRLVIVDLDNTLWGGVVGEEGWTNVDLDLESRGYGYLRLQRFLVGLHAKGVILAAVSKNNFDDAIEVFRNRREMILREHHFASMQINWEPKSQNVACILKELNLTATGAVFLDDSSFERGEIRAAFPEIFVPEFPEDPVDLVPKLISTGRFSVPRVTSEDQKRQLMYSEEYARRQERLSYTDLDDYYASLKLVMAVQDIDIRNTQRVLELIAKTNQFNLTTRRHNLEALERFRTSSENVAFAYNLMDIHGAYGLIGVVLGVREELDLRIDTWAMSCRAMGRNVEKAVICHVADLAKAAGANRLIGEYIPTSKNKPVADLYPALGFAELRQENGGTLYAFDLGQTLPKNWHVSIVSKQ
jgi:FkbH-like protein